MDTRMETSRSSQQRQAKEDMLATFISNAAHYRWPKLMLNGRHLCDYPHLLARVYRLAALPQVGLRQNHLSSLSAEIGRMKSLVYLDLSQNSLTTLPREIGRLKLLQELYCRENHLKELPDTLGRLCNLTKLDVASNKLSELPADIGDFKYLEMLDASGNTIHVLPPSFSKLQALEDLQLADNHLCVIHPAVVSGMTALKTLNFADNPSMIALPKELCDLEYLAELNTVGCVSLKYPSAKSESLADILQELQEVPKETLDDAVVIGETLATQCSETDATKEYPDKRPSISLSSSQSLPSKMVGPWVLGETIGKGGCARVKVAHHSVTGKNTAVKIVNKQRIGVDQKQVERFIREVVVGMLIAHPNIIRTVEAYETKHSFYIVMENAEGGELLDFLLNRHELLPEEKAKEIFIQLLAGVEYSHECNVIHRDLKLENVLMDKRGKVKIADYGLCNIQFGENHIMHSSCGSPFYAAPEVLRDEPYSGPAVDIWAMGVILYCLVCGFFPFDDANEAVLFQKIKKADYQPPFTGTRSVRDLIKRMLIVDPRERIGLKDILKHPWLNDKSGPQELSPSQTDFGTIAIDLERDPIDIAKLISRENNEDGSMLSDTQYHEKITSILGDRGLLTMGSRRNTRAMSSSSSEMTETDFLEDDSTSSQFSPSYSEPGNVFWRDVTARFLDVRSMIKLLDQVLRNGRLPDEDDSPHHTPTLPRSLSIPPRSPARYGPLEQSSWNMPPIAPNIKKSKSTKDVRPSALAAQLESLAVDPHGQQYRRSGSIDRSSASSNHSPQIIPARISALKSPTRKISRDSSAVSFSSTTTTMGRDRRMESDVSSTSVLSELTDDTVTVESPNDDYWPSTPQPRRHAPRTPTRIRTPTVATPARSRFLSTPGNSDSGPIGRPRGGALGGSVNQKPPELADRGTSVKMHFWGLFTSKERNKKFKEREESRKHH